MAQKTVWIAGSTQFTADCARSLLHSDAYSVDLCLTPAPKPIGRKHTITMNPLHLFASEQGIKTVLLETKITTEIKEQLLALSPPDILLVVDFGYWIPEWLLSLPTTAALNIHPSLLPRWRGSSPGQFVLLYGEPHSAVTLMQMTAGLDEGPIITQLPLTVQPTWNALQYYTAAFATITPDLPQLLTRFMLQPAAIQPQPSASPTPLATRLSKQDGYIAWEIVQAALRGEVASSVISNPTSCSPILAAASAQASSLAQLIERAHRAFSPWPGVWTVISTTHGTQRMKILSCSLTENVLKLDTVQIEGKTPVQFSEIKNILSV
ncbi:hypothetical protein KBC79_06170 [Candidatus Woesebacteria bacterium]|nr:hypothetical protein [Candidatus Woesebacteria bacterium]